MGRRHIYIPAASGFTPPTANLTGHWDASVSSSVHATATRVSQWDDQSGNGNNLLQAVAANQPVYSGTGTSSIITFSNSIGYFMKATFTFNQPETVYLVAKQVTWVGNTYMMDGSSTDKMDIFFRTSSPNFALYAGSFIANNADLTVGSLKVIAAVFNGASSSSSVNDGTKATGNCGANNAGGLTLGSNGNGSGAFGDVAVSEVYAYSAAHDNATQTSMVSYLRTKWGI